MPISKTEVDATAQELVVALVQETLKQKSILMPTLANYSQFVGPGQDVAKVPRRTQFAAADKAEDTDLSEQTITFSTDDIALSKHKAIYATVEMIASLQANVNVGAEVITEMANELALQVDKDLIVELKLASAAAPDHRIQFANTPANTIQQTDILEARRLLNVQNVPLNDRYLLIPPDQEKAMLLISDFVRADAYGSAGGLINGEVGRLYGATVLMHNSLSAAEFLYFHKSAVGYAFQLQPQFERDRLLKGVKEEYLLHQIYGCKVLDSGKRQVWFNATGA